MRQLQWLLGCLLVILSAGTVFFLDVEAWGSLAFTAGVALLALLYPSLPWRIPRWLHRAAFPLIACAFAADLWWSGEVMSSFIRLALLLLAYRSICYRRRREDMQLVLLGLFLMVVAGVLTVSLAFAGLLLLFTACALVLMLVVTVADAAEEAHVEGAEADLASGRAPSWTRDLSWSLLLRQTARSIDWRLAVLGAGLFGGLVCVSALLFVSIPRFQFENSLFLERFISRKARTGFSESVRFGQVTEIVQDTSLALSVDVSDPKQMPATPYFRMLILDEYIPEGGFRMSSRLRQELMSSERSSSFVRGTQRRLPLAPPTWTFYLESGVSRFLPVPGDFYSFRTKEPHPIQFNPRLQVAALRSEPVSMTAYRMENPAPLAHLHDYDFALRMRRAGLDEENRSRLAARFFLDMPKDAATTARAEKLAEDYAGGKGLIAADFARRAGEKLAATHGYSLSPRVPAGGGDPLIRWIDSREAGHCELFAGAFVLLARAAGHPARMVVGFRGGAWNAFSNSLSVRNSDAHAWCEIWDGDSSWLRVDPTPGASIVADAAADSGDVRDRRLDRSWSARLNSLRIFWYRRIVNFDQRTQVETLQSIREQVQATRKLVMNKLEGWIKKLKSQITVPWTPRRMRLLTLGLAATGLLLWALLRLRGRWRWGLTLHPRGKHDPVRREAGRWLRKLRRREVPTDRSDPTDPTEALQRLRYGARETWPEPTGIFRAAKKACRRRRAGTSA